MLQPLHPTWADLKTIFRRNCQTAVLTPDSTFNYKKVEQLSGRTASNTFCPLSALCCNIHLPLHLSGISKLGQTLAIYLTSLGTQQSAPAGCLGHISILQDEWLRKNRHFHIRLYSQVDSMTLLEEPAYYGIIEMVKVKNKHVWEVHGDTGRIGYSDMSAEPVWLQNCVKEFITLFELFMNENYGSA